MQNIEKIDLDKLIRILNQYWWPINISYQTESISNINYDLVKYHENKLNEINDYNISDLYSLYWLIDYALKDLWDEEFGTVTGLDLYEDWYYILDLLKNKILNR
jgi:hypothetical protein